MANKYSDQLNKYFVKLQDMDQKNWYYILAGLLVLVFVLDYFTLMKPQLGALSKISPEIKILSDNLKRTKTDIARITEYKDQIQKLKEGFDALRLRVRTKQEVPLVLEKISRIANKNRVKIDQIMPNPLQQKILLEGNDKTYFDLPIIIEARSGYHDFGRFINELENGDIFLKVDGFTIAAMPGSQLNAIQLTLKTIVVEENK
ncbi:MAG TPA: type 4a pilus biogenesis protein PilO [Candidatus Omnitrophota bacterium]|nr:type 4a pilus biogenesis protein PilO [Candidatus Omnitrophota bacterium]